MAHKTGASGLGTPTPGRPLSRQRRVEGNTQGAGDLIQFMYTYTPMPGPPQASPVRIVRHAVDYDSRLGRARATDPPLIDDRLWVHNPQPQAHQRVSRDKPGDRGDRCECLDVGLAFKRPGGGGQIAPPRHPHLGHLAISPTATI